MTMVQEQAGCCDIRKIESRVAGEYYITATPTPGNARQQTAQVYDEVASLLRRTGAAIVGERVFASADSVGDVMMARQAALQGVTDCVAPTVLLARDESVGLLGVQIHAVCGARDWRVIEARDGSAARTFACNGCRYLCANGITSGSGDGAPSQAHEVFITANELLGAAGASFFDVARTWIWMDDVVSWYGQLNQVRNRFFTEQGLMSKPGHLPASTGIGVSPARGRVALDVLAAWGGADVVTRFHAAGNQRSAYEYGSAFARASRVSTPGGHTVFVSGTAAIDPAGNTCFLNDISGQVSMTIENVIAVLTQMGCASGDVVQAMAYCASGAVMDHFTSARRDELPWPCLTMLGDVCRSNLLFEIEVTACPDAKALRGS